MVHCSLLLVKFEWNCCSVAWLSSLELAGLRVLAAPDGSQSPQSRLYYTKFCLFFNKNQTKVNKKSCLNSFDRLRTGNRDFLPWGLYFFDQVVRLWSAHRARCRRPTAEGGVNRKSRIEIWKNCAAKSWAILGNSSFLLKFGAGAV